MPTSKWLIFLLIFLYPDLHAITIGSDSAVSREAATIFLESQNPSDIKTFAAMANGFKFENVDVTCTFGSIFPTWRDINLNGGTVYLQRDLRVGTNGNLICLGNVYGNNYAFRCDESVTSFTLKPAPLGPPNIFFITSVNPGAVAMDVNSVGWSYDNAYAVCVNENVATSGFFAYSFNGKTLTQLTNSPQTLGAVGWVVRAHPSAYYFATGSAAYGGGPELKIYKISGGSVVTPYVASYETNGLTNTMAWSSTGTYLAACVARTAYMFTFNTATDTLTRVVGPTANIFATNVTAGSTCWDRLGQFFSQGDATGLYIVRYSSVANTITIATSSAIGSTQATDWSHTGSFIAAGLTSAAANNIQIYEYNNTTNTLTQRQAINVAGVNVLCVQWNDDTTKLAVATAVNAAGAEIRIYNFNSVTYALTLSDVYELNTTVNSIRWSRLNKQYFMTGDDADKLSIFSTSTVDKFTAQSMYFRNTNLEIANNLSWYMTSTMFGNCTINGKGRRITLADTGKIIVGSGGKLEINNVELAGLASNNLRCWDNTASIVLRNCNFRLDNNVTFSVGSILFNQENIFSGTNQFSYQSRMTSTIDSRSTLKIGPQSTFYYSPIVANRNLLYMTDKSSVLYLDGCTLKSTTTAPRLANGRLFLDNAVTLSSASTVYSESISLDLDVTLLSGASVIVYGGLNNTTA